MFSQRLIVFVAMSALFSTAAFAQVERGTVTGTVTDPSGAVVAGARVTIRNIGTNVETRTTGTSAGIYYPPSLPPPPHYPHVEQSGSRPAGVNDIVLGLRRPP